MNWKVKRDKGIQKTALDQALSTLANNKAPGLYLGCQVVSAIFYFFCFLNYNHAYLTTISGIV